MSLKNKYIFISCFLVIILFGCENSENKTDAALSYNFQNDSLVILNKAKKQFGNEVEFFVSGNFIDTVKEVFIFAKEIAQKEWGIKFLSAINGSDSLIKLNETKLLDGSFKGGKVQKINLPNYKNNFVYYNSQEFFMGSGGGEIFAYLINFMNNEIYYAHFFMLPNKPASLFLSKNILDKNIKEFFINEYKNDFPSLKIVEKDYKSNL